MDVSDRPGRQECRRSVTPCVGRSRHEDAVGHAGVQVHMVVGFRRSHSNLRCYAVVLVANRRSDTKIGQPPDPFYRRHSHPLPRCLRWRRSPNHALETARFGKTQFAPCNLRGRRSENLTAGIERAFRGQEHQRRTDRSMQSGDHAADPGRRGLAQSRASRWAGLGRARRAEVRAVRRDV